MSKEKETKEEEEDNEEEGEETKETSGDVEKHYNERKQAVTDALIQ
jgi:hypothetical protein